MLYNLKHSALRYKAPDNIIHFIGLIFDGLVKSRKCPLSVIPAKAGIQCYQTLIKPLDPVFQRGDDFLGDYHILTIDNI